jgi:hypothetical protein
MWMIRLWSTHFFSSHLGHICGAVSLWWCKTGPISGYMGIRPNRDFYGLVGHYFNYRKYILFLLKFASQGVDHVILHPLEKTTLDLGFTWMSYDHLMCERITLTLSPSQMFCLRIGSKLTKCSTWMIWWWPTRFLGHLGRIWGAVGLWWYKTRPISGYVSIKPNRGFLGLVGHYFNYRKYILLLIS